MLLLHSLTGRILRPVNALTGGDRSGDRRLRLPRYDLRSLSMTITGLENGPSKTGNPSGKGRGNNPTK